jgi:hypothetical protein
MVVLSRSENSNFLTYCQKNIKQKVESDAENQNKLERSTPPLPIEPEKFVKPDAMEGGLY